MHQVQKHHRINQMISFLYRTGLWHRRATATETILKLFYSIYYSLFPISLFIGAVTSDDKDDCVFLILLGTTTIVLFLKLLQIIWKKDELLEFLNKICVYSVEDDGVFAIINRRQEILMQFSTVFIVSAYVACISGVVVVPLIESERYFFVNFAFPLDWKNDDFAYVLANAFYFTEIVLSCVAPLNSAIVWYLLLNCALRYEILGYQIKNLAVVKVNEMDNRRKMSKIDKENLFLRNLLATIKLREFVKE